MIICMSDQMDMINGRNMMNEYDYNNQMICITNRNLCKGDFLEKIREVASKKPKAIILREKDLTEEEYARLSVKVKAICDEMGVICIYHTFIDTAVQQGVRQIHLPMPLLRMLSEDIKKSIDMIGVSCHSVEEAVEAEANGSSYIIAGHIFDTDCKKNIPGRGLPFLQEVASSVTIPVYGIGGITGQNLDLILKSGAAGGCMMSGYMQ